MGITNNDVPIRKSNLTAAFDLRDNYYNFCWGEWRTLGIKAWQGSREKGNNLSGSKGLWKQMTFKRQHVDTH